MAAEAQPLVEAAPEAGRAVSQQMVSQQAARQPTTWASTARIALWARCCLVVVPPNRFPSSTCASAPLPAAVGRVPPARMMIPAIERAIRPAEAVGRSSAVMHAQPATVRPAAV
jgi:hypothetical protein